MNSIEFKNITKIFPGVKALDEVSFKAHSGQIVAICGENGAGKSTLLKILNGDYQQDGGAYYLDGKEQNFKSPQEAIQAGISVIYQERQIVPYLSVAENIFMEDVPSKRGGIIDTRRLNAEAQKIIDRFKLPIKPTEQVRNISIAHQQMVEIMKAYRRKPKVIAFDEPTAPLSDKEIETLFNVIEDLRSQGLIILYVSHRLKEIFQITDEVVVIKDGKYVKQLKTKETDERELIRLMVGRDLGDVFAGLRRSTDFGEKVLEVKGLTNQYVRDVSFHVRAGECVGFAGLVGAGRTETLRAVFGADPYEKGEIIFEGKPVHPRSPSDAIAMGICFCPEDRKDQGIFPVRSVRDNLSLAALKQVSRGQWIQKKKEAELAEKYVRDLRIKTPNIRKIIRELSGGNQQKVILARWLAMHPKVLILDEPTKGIDVGAKAEIYQMTRDLAAMGIAVIIVSSELPEIIGISDRIIVMHDGRITGELAAKDATEELVLEYAMK